MSALMIVVALLSFINFLTFLILTITLYGEYDDNPPILCQQHLWLILEDNNINFIGKLILCILTIPFTVFYTIGTLGYRIGSFIIINIWKLFCLAFKKR